MKVIIRRLGLFIDFTLLLLRSGGVSASLLVCSLLAPAFAITNSLTITEKGGVTTANYPVQLGRPFAMGEIAACPRAIIGGAPASAWQADVKNRWPDGSVKFAVIAFLIPSLAANATVTITFDSQPCSNAALTKAAMQTDANYNFNATIALTNGSTVTASARTMLDADSYTLWTSGQVAQTIILADHTNTTTCNGHPCSAYDMGLGTYPTDKPFRPIFHATFWPTINKVHLRYVGEICNTEALADQDYSLSLTAGKASPATVYTQSSFTHGAGKRWTVSTNNQSGQTWTISTPGGNITVEKEIWIGGAPTPIQINHNLAYLISTKAVYNYDTTFIVPESTIATIYTDWDASSHTSIGNGAKLTLPMGTTGGRYDIGPFDGWSTQWLYTQDPRSQLMSTRHSELAGWWPLHWREGKSAKKITRTTALACTYQCDRSGVGKPMSVTSRPTIYTGDFSFGGTAEADRVIPISMASDGTWHYSSTHIQEYQTVPYILTGDFWYLEELQFLAAQSVANEYNAPSRRWPTGYESNLANAMEPRGFAWKLRTRAHAAYFSVDNTPEKSYFELGLKDGLAFAEGWHNVTGSALYNDSYFRKAWDSGKSVNVDIDYTAEGTPPAWHPWDRGYDMCDDPDIDNCAALSTTQSPWMIWYAITAMGRAKELGYASGTLLTYAAVLLNGMITDSGYDPYLIAQYRVPVLDSSNHWFATLAAVKAPYSSAAESRKAFHNGLTTDSYAAYARAAASFTKAETNGTAAWNWMAANAVINYSTDPTWAILPRNTVPLVPSSCDLNSDGRVDLLDVQLAVNQALGISPCTNADLDGSGTCTVLDIQRVVNAAMGGSCRLGP